MSQETDLIVVVVEAHQQLGLCCAALRTVGPASNDQISSTVARGLLLGVPQATIMNKRRAHLNFDIMSQVISWLQTEKELTAPGANLLPSSAYRSSCNALLSLARACHTLKGPSLKALWRRQDHLLPVLKLIPQLALESPSAQSRRGYWFIDGLVSIPDWNTFDRYAQMIQEIHFSPRMYESEVIHDSVYVYISSSREGVIFPNLSTVATVVGTAVHLFCSATLRRIVITDPIQTDRPNPWASNFITRVCAMSPSLQQVELGSVFVHFSALQALLTIPGVHALRFQLTPWALRTHFQEIVGQVPTLHNLEHLSIWCFDRSLSIPTSSNAHARHRRLQVPKIHTINFQGSLGCIVLLCESIQGVGLRSFCATARQESVECSQVPFYERIWQQLCLLSTNDLVEISFEMGYHRPGFDSTMVSHLSPLYYLQNLRKLSFRSFTPFVATDSDLRLMGESWPYLQVLIIPLPTSLCPPRVTPRGLGMLAELCPYLETLDLTFDATDLSAIPVDFSSALSNTGDAQRNTLDRSEASLWRLNVNDSPLNQTCIEPMITMLKHLFPNMETLDCAFGSHESAFLWSEVRDGVLDYN